ncbi:MAG: rod shape-determining protein MreC [Bacteroidetes bacterium]|nr:rod shape-determining protein MreC [Bacteroidota bacterium]
MLKRVYDIATLFKEYVIFAILLVVSVTLLALNDTRQIRTIRSLTVVSLGFLQDTFGSIPDYFNLKSENRILREINITLSDDVNRLREARLENIRLRRLLGLRHREKYRYVSARIVGKTLQLLRNAITINVGSDDGVHSNMPVVTDRGLVGRVTTTSSAYSIGQILYNREIRISAKVQRSRVDGIIRWEGGEYLSLTDVARTLDVKPGDVLITSDYSSLFPPGIRIGTVASTRLLPGSLFQHVDIAPSVDFTQLEEVFVLLHCPDTARVTLETSGITEH